MSGSDSDSKRKPRTGKNVSRHTCWLEQCSNVVGLRMTERKSSRFLWPSSNPALGLQNHRQPAGDEVEGRRCFALYVSA